MYQKVIAQIRKEYKDISCRDDEKIKEAVQLLLKNIHRNGEEKYPLPVVRLLSQMNFGLFRTRFENPNQSGLIAVDSALPEMNKLFSTDRIILVNEQDSTAHQRFTIVHELAHYIFDFDEAVQPTYYKAYLTTEKSDPGELRANRFAAELLMPTDDFCAKCDELERAQGDAFSLPNTITQLHKFFDAPVTAVKKRLEEVGKFQVQEDDIRA